MPKLYLKIDSQTPWEIRRATLHKKDSQVGSNEAVHCFFATIRRDKDDQESQHQ